MHLQLHYWRRSPGTFGTVAGRHLAAVATAGLLERLAAIVELPVSTMAMWLAATSTALGNVGDYAAQESCR